MSRRSSDVSSYGSSRSSSMRFPRPLSVLFVVVPESEGLESLGELAARALPHLAGAGRHALLDLGAELGDVRSQRFELHGERLADIDERIRLLDGEVEV